MVLFPIIHSHTPTLSTCTLTNSNIQVTPLSSEKDRLNPTPRTLVLCVLSRSQETTDCTYDRLIDTLK